MFPDHKKTTPLMFLKKIEGRVTKKLSQEFSRIENCVLGALSRLDDFLLNPLSQGHYGTAPEPLRNRSGDVPERIWHKPGNEWGRLPEWSSSWSEHLQKPDDTKVWHGRLPCQTVCNLHSTFSKIKKKNKLAVKFEDVISVIETRRPTTTGIFSAFHF